MLDKNSTDNIENTEIPVPQNSKWADILKGLNMFSDDFMENGREQPKLQNQKLFE